MLPIRTQAHISPPLLLLVAYCTSGGNRGGRGGQGRGRGFRGGRGGRGRGRGRSDKPKSQADLDAEMDAYWLGTEKGKDKLDAEMDEYWASARKEDGEDAGQCLLLFCVVS